MGNYDNKLKGRQCPVCGHVRTLDWFNEKDVRCWQCRQLKRDLPKDDDGEVLIGGVK